MERTASWTRTSRDVCTQPAADDDCLLTPKVFENFANAKWSRQKRPHLRPRNVNHQQLCFAQSKRRYLSLLKTRGGRDKLRSRLPHFRDFDSRFTISIPPSRQTAADIHRALQERHAPKECYVWSSSSKCDGRTLNLNDVLSSIVGWEPGTILLCIPGHLGYYEGEDPNERLILAK
jgi:hypothetical protein